MTNATWNDFWLNEGFTVYFEPELWRSFLEKIMKTWRQSLPKESCAKL
ncbi:MAG: hypothetical protein IPN36_06875 [Bacteroidetes bacterium]|nr:hypothetical protein [Bacteroidota bacterium]